MFLLQRVSTPYRLYMTKTPTALAPGRKEIDKRHHALLTPQDTPAAGIVMPLLEIST